jgi:hypothetical protein
VIAAGQGDQEMNVIAGTAGDDKRNVLLARDATKMLAKVRRVRDQVGPVFGGLTVVTKVVDVEFSDLALQFPHVLSCS